MRLASVQDSETVRAAVDYAHVYAEYNRRQAWVPFSDRQRFGPMTNAEVEAALGAAQRRVYEGALRMAERESAATDRVVEAVRGWMRTGDEFSAAIKAFNERDEDDEDVFPWDIPQRHHEAERAVRDAIAAYDAQHASRVDGAAGEGEG